jgi:death on curing protein
MKDPLFLLVDEVLLIHARLLDEHGGQAGVRDHGLLESAVATPQASFGGDYLHEDLCAMAAAYAFHIAENQPFVDGNKRAAMGAALVFLRVNGLRVPPSDAVLYDAMIAIADRRMKKDDLAALFRRLATET